MPSRTTVMEPLQDAAAVTRRPCGCASVGLDGGRGADGLHHRLPRADAVREPDADVAGAVGALGLRKAGDDEQGGGCEKHSHTYSFGLVDELVLTIQRHGTAVVAPMGNYGCTFIPRPGRNRIRHRN